MFTGLVETMGRVAGIRIEGDTARLTIESPLIAEDAGIGDSVAINGCCLTVVEKNNDQLQFDAGEETLRRTNLGRFEEGTMVNLERSLRVGDRMGGHFVTGHIDGVGHLDRREDDDEWSTCWFRIPPELGSQLASKGSIAVDGVSLTLVDVEADRFSVALIPHTLEVTTLGQLPLMQAPGRAWQNPVSDE